MTRFAPLALLLALAASGAALAQTCTTSWLPDAGGVWNPGDWADADRWDNGVPTPADTACVLGAGTRPFTVTSGQPQTVGGLVVGSPTAALVLQLDAELTVTGAGRLFGNDRIDGDLALGGTFELDAGNLARSGGTVTVLSSGALVVAASGSSNGFISQIGDLSAAGSPSTVVVEGRFEAQESITVGSTLRVASGVIAAQPNALNPNAVKTFILFQSGGDLGTIQFDTEAETEVLFDGDYTVSGRTDGTVEGVAGFARRATVEVVGGAEFAVGGAGGFAFGLPQTGPASELLITGSGDIVNSGLLRFPTTQRTFQGVSLRTLGTVQFDSGGGSLTLADGADLIVEDTGTLRFAGSGNQFIYGIGATFGSPEGEERVVLRGRLVQAGDGASDAINVPIDIEGGQIEAPSGVIRLTGGGTIRGIEVDIGADASVTLTGLSITVPSTYTASGSITGTSAGFFGFSSVSADTTVVVADGAVVWDVAGEGVGLARSRVVLRETANGGSFVNRGHFQRQDGSQLEIRGTTLRNEGLWTAGSLTLTEGAEVTNTTGSTTQFVLAGIQPGDETGRFVNEGLVIATQTSSFSGRLESRPGAELRADIPLTSLRTLALTEADSLAVGPGSLLTGRANVSQSRDLVLRGVVSPGSPDAPVDSLGIRELQIADAPGAGLTIDIDAQGRHDLVATGFGAAIGGTLTVRIDPAYQPTPGESFDIINSFRPAPVTGTFSEIVVEGLADGLAVGLDATELGNLNLRIGAPVAVAPEAGSVAEGETGAFVLTHPAASEAYRVAVAVEGTATPC